jgi:hypothetical protein
VTKAVKKSQEYTRFTAINQRIVELNIGADVNIDTIIDKEKQLARMGIFRADLKKLFAIYVVLNSREIFEFTVISLVDGLRAANSQFTDI